MTNVPRVVAPTLSRRSQDRLRRKQGQADLGKQSIDRGLIPPVRDAFIEDLGPVEGIAPAHRDAGPQRLHQLSADALAQKVEVGPFCLLERGAHDEVGIRLPRMAFPVATGYAILREAKSTAIRFGIAWILALTQRNTRKEVHGSVAPSEIAPADLEGTPWRESQIVLLTQIFRGPDVSSHFETAAVPNRRRRRLDDGHNQVRLRLTHLLVSGQRDATEVAGVREPALRVVQDGVAGRLPGLQAHVFENRALGHPLIADHRDLADDALSPLIDGHVQCDVVAGRLVGRRHDVQEDGAESVVAVQRR